MKRIKHPITPYPAKAIPVKCQIKMNSDYSLNKDIYTGPLDIMFFPVKLYHLFWEDENPDSFFENSVDHFECEDRFAVVGVNNWNVYSTVTKGYYLILNEEVYQLGLEIAEYVFNTEEDALTAHLDVLTKKGAACEFSIHRTIELNQPALLGGWRAVVKMTNSYNKTKPVSYIIGFEYGVDGGAVFLPGFTYKVKDAHTRPLRRIREDIFDYLQNTKTGETIRKIEVIFEKLIATLQSIKMAKADMLKMFCKIYIKKYDGNVAFKDLDYIYGLLNKYSSVSNCTAYTLLLVFGEYVKYKYCRSFGHNLSEDQLALGEWAMAFAKEATRPVFSFHNYFGAEISDLVSRYMSERGL